jgi:hypothetical protein
MSGFVFDDRASREPQFPDNQRLIDMAKWNREHQTAKPAEPGKLSELDKLRKRAEAGGLF